MATFQNDKDSERIIYRDEIAHYIIPVLTFQIIHSLLIFPFSSFHIENAFVAEIEREFDVLYENRDTVQSAFVMFPIPSFYLLKIEIFSENKRIDWLSDIKRQVFCFNFFSTDLCGAFLREGFLGKGIRQYKDLWNVCEDRCW